MEEEQVSGAAIIQKDLGNLFAMKAIYSEIYSLEPNVASQNISFFKNISEEHLSR
jgi:hypothetical protein